MTRGIGEIGATGAPPAGGIGDDPRALVASSPA
jgi:hypothetical protein